MCEPTSKADTSEKRVEDKSVEENVEHKCPPLPEWCDPECRGNHLFVFMKSSDNTDLVFKNISCYSIDVSEFNSDIWLSASIVADGLRKKGLYPNTWILKRRVLLDWSRANAKSNTKHEPMGVTNYEAMTKWDYWLSHSIWSSEDSALLLEFGPFKLPGINIHSDISQNSSFFDTLKLVNSYVGSGKEPYDIVNWAISENKISIPMDLIAWHKYVSTNRCNKDQRIEVTKDVVINITRGLLSSCVPEDLVAKSSQDNPRGKAKVTRWEILNVGLYSLEGFGYNTIVTKLLGNSSRHGGRWAEIRRKKFVDLMLTEHGIDCKKFMPN